MKAFFLVFLGGGIGSLLRYGVFLVMKFYNHNSLWATLSVNITGSIILGFVMGHALKEGQISNNLILFLATGLCGGFTTFSTFAFENKTLISSGEYMTFFLYAFGSLTGGMVAILLGIYMSKLI